VRPVQAALMGAACYRSQSRVSAVGAGPSCAHLDHSVQLLAATPRLSSLQTRARQGRWAQWSGDGRVGRQVGSLANWAAGRQAGRRAGGRTLLPTGPPKFCSSWALATDTLR
jgi:hypothetical protein